MERVKGQKGGGYGTVDSRVVAHPSTNTAWRSLTSLFGWEAVLSAQYGRIQQSSLLSLYAFPVVLSLPDEGISREQ